VKNRHASATASLAGSASEAYPARPINILRCTWAPTGRF
jgi:hypothetical protein